MTAEPRNWMFSCGECGASVLMVNCRPTREGDGCRACASDLDRNPFSEDGTWFSRVKAEAGWCACDEDIDALMLAYLAQTADGRHLTYDDDAGMLLAHLADSLGWTEHGTSLKYAWLTDAGMEARDNLAGALQGST